MTKYIYVRDEVKHVKMDQYNTGTKRGFPVGCFAYDLNPIIKGGQIIAYNIRYGYSIYNSKDKFSKHTARVVAEYRKIMHPQYFYTFSHINKAISELMFHVSTLNTSPWSNDNGKSYNVPLRFRRACARMSTYLDLISKLSNNKEAA